MLSQIGVNIAPLLAGASVIGLAVGIGSQKLVQDIITGLFLLLENTMQVGDVVSLGGLQGTVEALSIRTIRLRAVDGSVHIVPFSAVTTVTNMTRDFAYAVVDVNVGLNEDPDRIADIVRQIAREMREEPRWTAPSATTSMSWAWKNSSKPRWCCAPASKPCQASAGRWGANSTGASSSASTNWPSKARGPASGCSAAPARPPPSPPGRTRPRDDIRPVTRGSGALRHQ
ncbi:MAG: mechanosensitive ion channel [Thermomicrobiales bacterium]